MEITGLTSTLGCWQARVYLALLRNKMIKSQFKDFNCLSTPNLMWIFFTDFFFMNAEMKIWAYDMEDLSFLQSTLQNDVNY